MFLKLEKGPPLWKKCEFADKKFGKSRKMLRVYEWIKNVKSIWMDK